MFVNTMPRYEILSADSIAVLERGWRRIVSEIGIQFAKPEAVELFAKAGQQVDGDVVKLDPDFVLEQVAKAPREFDVQARNPAHNVHIGGDHMVFSAVYGCPFVREGDVRRDATLQDFRQLASLSQAYDELDSAGGVICEPNDAPLDSRHLDMIYALQTLTDKIYMGNVVSGPNAADTIAMTSILFGGLGGAGRTSIERTPATISLINCNSPLRWDDRMLDAQFEYCAAGQPVVLTPFLLMGAMSPVTIPAALTQQLAEALSGIALAQLIRPGTPVIFGSFLSNIDMQSGSPSFGTPESAIGLLCTGQLARHYGLPFRTGGGLNSSQTADAQSAYEALMTLLPTFLAGTNFVMHAAGWKAAWSAATRSSSSTSSCCASCGSSSPRWRSPRNRWRSVRTPRSGTAATSSARSTRWNASATASSARGSPPPRTSSAGSSRAARTPPPGPARSGARSWNRSRRRRWTTPSAPSWTTS
jgi:trimethylamine---corrinoid protein Co-methyltransferase